MRTAMKIVLVLAFILILTGIAGSVFSFVQTTHKEGLDESFYIRSGMMGESHYTRSGKVNDYREFCYDELDESCPIESLPIR